MSSYNMSMLTCDLSMSTYEKRMLTCKRVKYTESLSFGMENYLNILSPQCMKIMIKFRTTNHHLPLETGRWQNKN